MAAQTPTLTTSATETTAGTWSGGNGIMTVEGTWHSDKSTGMAVMLQVKPSGASNWKNVNNIDGGSSILRSLEDVAYFSLPNGDDVRASLSGGDSTTSLTVYISELATPGGGGPS